MRSGLDSGALNSMFRETKSMLRQITKEDFDRVYFIYVNDIVLPYMTFDRCSKTEFQEYFDAFSSRDEFLGLEVNGQIQAVGTVIRNKWRRKHVALVASVAVAPDSQRKGFGSSLMVELMDYLKASGVKRLELTVEVDNPIAIRLYEKLGFEREGIKKGNFLRASGTAPIDDIMMAKLL